MILWTAIRIKGRRSVHHIGYRTGMIIIMITFASLPPLMILHGLLVEFYKYILLELLFDLW